MKEIFRYGFILALICSIAGGLLSGVNFLTRQRIIAQVQAEEDASLKEVIPEAGYFDAVKSEKGDILYYKAYSRDKKLLGIAFKTSAKGYSSNIETMAGMDKTGRILAIKVIQQNEAPGLGSRISEKSFTNQFENKNIADLAGVQAITGATISSKAVIASVQNKAEEIKALIKNEK
ncbi:MAG: RnfABCDGE type electron transport complex subunit G [Candidatus Omnitrophota bacterium]